MATTKKRIAKKRVVKKKPVVKKTTLEKPAPKRAAKRATPIRPIMPDRIDDIGKLDVLKIDPDDRDATKRVKKIKADVEKRKTPVITRGPSGVTRSAVDRIGDPPAASGVVLIERVLDSIERELVAIDKVTGNGHVNAKQRTESERRARTLASLAKTLGEVTRLRGLHDKKASPADDAAVPRDLDEFRRELARRLEALSAEPQSLPAGGDAVGGDGVSGEAVANLCPRPSETA